MIGISTWYTTLGEYSFPTVFLALDPEERDALTAGELTGPAPKRVAARLQRAIRNLTGACFVGADVCAPTDSPHFRAGRWVSFGRSAWKLLASSEKVRAAFLSGQTCSLTVRPFRRMDRSREFRMFFHERHLTAMSQYHLDGCFPKIVGRQVEVWRSAKTFGAVVAKRLPVSSVVADAYLTSSDRWMLVDLNPWGSPTDPLLFKTWDRDWGETPGLKLVPGPVKMKGDISVSF
ncbi:MAG: hypothetical protein GXP31_16215 [Kiritimatiellaeota bacterium]|nr:hypothetical protein [Kiritimatiellota bacterium]